MGARMVESATKISTRWLSAPNDRVNLVSLSIASGARGKNGALATNVVDKGNDFDTFRFSQLAGERYARHLPLKRLLTVRESATRRRTAYGNSGCIGVIVHGLAERMVGAAASA